MKSRKRYLGVACAGLLVYLSVLPVELAAVRFSRAQITGVDTRIVRVALKDAMIREQFPDRFRIKSRDQWVEVNAEYTIRPKLQEYLDDIYQRWKPDYAAFFAMDAVTGSVLAYADFVRHAEDDVYGHLALNALFPAASVFKIITAAAALDTDTVRPDSILPYNGKSTSLYKKQVLHHKDHKWTRRPTLKKAFATSVNTVFARLGVYELGADAMNEYAQRFAFNRHDLLTDIPIDLGVSNIEDEQWVLAEVASGYTERNTLSPVHGAMLASAIANDGRIAVPYGVKRLTNSYGWPLYVNEPRHLTEAIGADTVEQMRVLMQETVRRGSARRFFRGFFKGRDIEVGGKTGSLSGDHPKGRNEWFVGYARRGDERIAFASLTVSKKKWRVKPARVARKFAEKYFASRDN
ncbi:MAG: Penicillin-binding protein 2B [Gammaproteobacteria bacterium]|nr:Penicillin-binding protein 2B [Gammaproteobacteria bacterium]